jgi:Fe-S-cluster containining protein
LKDIDLKQIDQIPGRRIKPGDTFLFRCHKDLACFNQCCRNLYLFLYPYDVLRLKNHLGLSSDEFIDKHTDLVMRQGSYFPEVLLRMADNAEQTCPFLTGAGCGVYPDRPDTCREFPIEQGLLFEEDGLRSKSVYFYRPPDFCLGQHENRPLTIKDWTQDQEARTYSQMTAEWARIRHLFRKDPWGPEGFQGKKGKMAFMAAYNLDQFRNFVFQSTFLKRYRVKPALAKKMRANDTALLTFGFEWIKVFVWGMASKQIQLKQK